MTTAPAILERGGPQPCHLQPPKRRAPELGLSRSDRHRGNCRI